MKSMNMCVLSMCAVAGIGASESAFGGQQGIIGPSLGTVELRWRERSTPGYNGSYILGPGAAAGVDMVPTPDPSAASVTAQDASVVLVLEARVTQASGIIGPAIRGLKASTLDIMTNQNSGGAFGRQVVPDGIPDINPRGNARVNATNLGFDPATLMDHPSGSPRGVVSPFRDFAQHQGGLNGPAVGSFQSGVNRIHRVTPALQYANLDPANIDATHPGQYELAGLNEWVPIYIAVYNITDVTTARDIVFTIGTDRQPVPGLGVHDYDFRTWRGQQNPSNSDLDLWQLLPAFTTPPTFTVHVVPAPGVGAMVMMGGMLAMRRRR